MSNIKGRNKTEKSAHDFIDFFEEVLPVRNSKEAFVGKFNFFSINNNHWIQIQLK